MICQDRYFIVNRIEEKRTIIKMFCVGFNSNRCTGCDQPHWCVIRFSYEHNAINLTGALYALVMNIMRSTSLVPYML